MKKILNNIGRFFNITFAIFTCTSFAMMLLNSIVGNAKAPEWSGILLLFLHILLFSAITALAEVVFDVIKNKNGVLSRVLKFAFSYGGFYLCFFALVSGNAEPSNIIVLSTVFVVIYAAVCGLFALIKHAADAKAAESAEYHNVYDNSGKNN